MATTSDRASHATDKPGAIVSPAGTPVGLTDGGPSGHPGPGLAIEAEGSFEADLARMPEQDRAQTRDAIRAWTGLLLTDRGRFERELSRPYIPRIAGGLETTLFLMPLSSDRNVVLALDDDPLFDRILVTLYRVVEGREAEGAFRTVAAELYGADHGGQGE